MVPGMPGQTHLRRSLARQHEECFCAIVPEAVGLFLRQINQRPGDQVSRIRPVGMSANADVRSVELPYELRREFVNLSKRIDDQRDIGGPILPAGRIVEEPAKLLSRDSAKASLAHRLGMKGKRIVVGWREHDISAAGPELQQ